ncbi:MAG: hypothetical protein H0V44_16420 [Planctomycetes bacterium]|nr:hypothetical protein [Planctomycetota bacterium]
METTAIQVPSTAPWAEARAIHATLREHGAEAWLVGGCVRDLLLGRAVKDVDIATGASPEEIEQWFPRTVAVGKSFGVIIVVTPSKANVEVASFRSDGAYIDGRRPTSIVPTDARSDVERRDFTINALLLDPLDGTVFDHVGGLADLRDRCLRAVGDAAARLSEDRLRVLRALRFAAGLGFAIEPRTWQAIRTTPLAGLSAERIVQEWFKGLACARPGAWLRLLAESGRLAEVTPPLGQDLVAETATALDRLGPRDDEVAAAVWLSRVSVPAALAWLGGLPLEKASQRRITWLIEQLRTLPRHHHAAIADRRRLAGHPQAEALVAAARACLPDDSGQLAFVADRAAERARPPFAPWVRASDLLALGLRPGPRVGVVLRRLENAQLEGSLADRDQALEQARIWLAGEA